MCHAQTFCRGSGSITLIQCSANAWQQVHKPAEGSFSTWSSSVAKAASGLRVGRLRGRPGKLMETLGTTGLQAPPGSFLSPVMAELPCPDDVSAGRWHRSRHQMSPAGCAPSRAHSPLLPPPAGWPRGDGSVCKPAPSPSPHTARPPQPYPKPPLCSSSCLWLSSVAHPGLPSHPRVQGRAQRPRAGSGGGLWRGAEGNAAPAKEATGLPVLGRTIAGVIPARVVAARGRRDNLAFNSQVPEATAPEGGAGTAGQQTLPHFTTVNGSCSPHHHPHLGCV